MKQLLFFSSFIFILLSWTTKPVSTIIPFSQKTSISPEPGDTLIVGDMIFADFFSPNGDGSNDTYIILNVENYLENSFKVFNRWGDLVYKAAPYENDWNGESNVKNGFGDNKLRDGVYFFVFDDGLGTKASGKITLKL